MDETLQILEEDLATEMEILKHDEEALDYAMRKIERTKKHIQEIKDDISKLTPVIHPNE